MKKKIILLLSTITIWNATAQEIYTIDECRTMALKQNVRIKTSRNDLMTAQQEKKEAFSNYFPSVSLAGGGMLASEGLLQIQMGPEKMILMKDGLMGGVTASLPIFAGGQIYNGNKLAQLGVKVSELKLRQTENEIRLTVEQNYWQIIVLKEKLRTVQTIEQHLDRLDKDVTAAVNAGITNHNDQLQVKLRKNDIQSTRINLENTLELCKMLLAQYIGVEQSDFDVAASISEQIPDSPDYLFVDHHAALSTTLEYQLLNKNVEANRLQKRMTLGKHLPTVAVGGGYLYHDLMGFSQNAAVGLLSVSIPISWKTPYDMKKQKYRYQNAVTQFDDGKEQLVIRMQKAWNDLNNAYKQIHIAENSIKQATENLRLNENYYKAGTSSMSDLLEAQTLFQQSRDKYAEAYSQYEIKKLEYLQATGR